LVHIAIIFAALPGDQRLPHGLSAAPCGNASRFFTITNPWNFSAICVPALLLYIVLPLAIENHREEAPPVRLVRYLEKLYPPSKRGNVLLILPTTRRSAQWYAPEFKIMDHVSTSQEDEEVLRNAAAVYTEDPSLKGKERYLIELDEFRRSMLIYLQHRRVQLYLVERRRSS